LLKVFFSGNAKSVASKWKTSHAAKRRILLVLMLWFAVVAVLMLRGVGRWLICEDPLAKADVIVVLSGSMPYRAREAAKVYKMGFAPEVWVSRPEGPDAELEQLGVHYVGEQEYNRDVLIHEGVPESSVHILPDASIDTEQEVEEISREMQWSGKHRVIFITSSQHTRRVKALWRKLAATSITASVHGSPEDPFDRDHWWRNTRDALSVVREVLGLINVWAGLPVRPHLSLPQ
jgi:uncharacterized SAM-binding protein YcdF (DUF218 family)